MRLLTALRVEPSDVVAFTGGGGKTTAMFRLAEEIVQAGGQVVTTTTTRIFAAQIGLAPDHVVAHGLPAADPAALDAVAAVLAASRHVLVTAPIEAGSEKAPGVHPAWIAAFRALPGRPAVLIEADGSRMRPFKAPAEHEPVIPPETGLVVPSGDADALADAIVVLAGDLRHAAAMGSAGRERALEEFTPEQCVRRIEDLYRGALAPAAS